MDGEALLERLSDVGVVENTGDDVSLTASFADRKAAIERGEVAVDGPAWLEAADLDRDLRPAVRAIDAVDGDLSREETVAAARVVERIENPPVSSGVPEGFVPLRDEDLNGFLRDHRCSVVFVWKEGSSSCERMRETLDGVCDLPTVDERTGLGSICVADASELLRERYDVGLLPTTLFCVGERVDSRVIGPREFDVVEREIEIVSEAASAH